MDEIWSAGLLTINRPIVKLFPHGTTIRGGIEINFDGITTITFSCKAWSIRWQVQCVYKYALVKWHWHLFMCTNLHNTTFVHVWYRAVVVYDSHMYPYHITWSFQFHTKYILQCLDSKCCLKCMSSGMCTEGNLNVIHYSNACLRHSVCRLVLPVYIFL